MSGSVVIILTPPPPPPPGSEKRKPEEQHAVSFRGSRIPTFCEMVALTWRIWANWMDPQ